MLSIIIFAYRNLFNFLAKVSLLCLCFIPSSVWAETGILIVPEMHSISNSRSISQLKEFVAGKTSESDVVFVLDSKNGSIAAEGYGAVVRTPDFQDRLSLIIDSLSIQHLNTNVGIDLVSTSSVIGDLIHANATVENWKIYFLGSVYHSLGDWKIDDFHSGYPNDGFLVKKDTQLGFLKRDFPQKKIEAHVFYKTPMKFKNEYFRFYTHFFDRFYNASLLSFNDGFDEGSLPDIEVAEINSDVKNSRVIQGTIIRPDCETDDRHQLRELSGSRVQVSLQNPCRANTVVTFANGEDTFSAEADESGNVLIDIPLSAGTNNLLVKSVDNNQFTRLATYTQGITPDAITTAVENDLLNIVGYNPQREDGDLVEIRNESNNKIWKVAVEKNAWNLTNVPLQPGTNTFSVLQTDGISRQLVRVETKSDCKHSRNTNQVDDVIDISFVDKCLANKTLVLDYKGDEYPVRFDANGRGDIRISLRDSNNQIRYNLRGTERLIEVPFARFLDIIKVVLTWSGNIDLDLHVLEPGGTEIYFDNINEDGQNGLGKMTKDERGAVTGLQTESYFISLGTLSATENLDVKVKNYSRANDFGPEHCKGGAFEEVPFTVEVFKGGTSEKFRSVFSITPCENNDESGYFMSITEVKASG